MPSNRSTRSLRTLIRRCNPCGLRLPPLTVEIEDLAIAAALTYRACRTCLDVAGSAALPMSYRKRQLKATAVALEAALSNELGADYRDRMIVPGLHQSSSTAVAWSAGLAARRRYAQHVNVSYGDGGQRNWLDIWKSPGCRDGAPVMIGIPGGAWIAGSKSGQGQPLMASMVEQGWIGVSINYRLGLRNKWPAAIIDVRRAIAWVKGHIAEYGGDPSFLALTGGSAGAHLASLAALSAMDPEWQPGFEDVDTSVQAVVPLYGSYDWTPSEHRNPLEVAFLERYVVHGRYEDDVSLFRNASPLHRVCAQAPPFFVLHGERDRILPRGPEKTFVESLRAVSQSPAVFTEVPGAPHSFDVLATRRTREVVDAVGRFLAVVYGDKVRRTGGEEAASANEG